MIYSLAQKAPHLHVTLECERLDAISCPEFNDTMLSLLRDNNFQSLKVDFVKVSFVDSTGLGALVNLLKTVPSPEMLILCGMNPVIMELLRLTRLNEVFIIEK